MTKIGVLALQGAFIEHCQILRRLAVDCIELRKPADISQDLDGLILPGGESTVMGKLLNNLGMLIPIRKMISEGLPVFGTCAGMILLAQRLSEDSIPRPGTMDITVRRNAYGRQIGSFNTVGTFAEKRVPMTFIRAPYIEEAGTDVQILSVENGHIVAAEQGNQLVTAFHPELTDDPTVHQHFLDMIS